MTAAEYRRLIAAGKIRPASEQKRKAAKRSTLESQATDAPGKTGGVKLIEVVTRYDRCTVKSYIHPDHVHFAEAHRRAEREY